MHRILNRFRSLRWKLTLSYTAVTVAALLVAQLLAIGAVILFITNSRFLPRLSARVMVGAAGQAAPFLETQPPDIAGLQSWMLTAANNGFETTTEGGGQMSFSPMQMADQGALLIAYDAQGNFLVNALPGDPDRPPEISPELNMLIAKARTGADNPEELYRYTPENLLLIAAPIKNQKDNVLGVLAFSGRVIPVDQPVGELLQALGISVLFFTLASGAVGTLFGFLTARGLTRRLGSLSQAADSWSHGDFSVFVRDRSQDELGQLADRLNRMAEQLQNLLHTRQELAALEERNRLARDLHDSAKQQIFATSMHVGAARALLERDLESAGEHLNEAEKLARQAQTELTTLIHQLRPAALEDKGLAEALCESMNSWSRQTGIKTNLRLQGERRLPLHIEMAIYRVTQEALANAARHSGASQVDLRLVWTPEKVSLAIQDNGAGFDPQAVNGKGIGLQSMAERLSALNGSLTVDSSPEQGTLIRAEIPFRPEKESDPS